MFFIPRFLPKGISVAAAKNSLPRGWEHPKSAHDPKNQFAMVWKNAKETRFQPWLLQVKLKSDGNFAFLNHRQNTLSWTSRENSTSRLSSTPGQKIQTSGSSPTEINFVLHSTGVCQHHQYTLFFKLFKGNFSTVEQVSKSPQNLWGSGGEAPGNFFYNKKLLNGPWKHSFFIARGGP